MRHRPLPRLVLAIVATGLFAVAPEAAAQAPPSGGGGMGMTGVPGPEAFTIRYWITNEEGAQVRTMQKVDFLQYVNRARCECGHKIVAEVRLKATMSGYNQGTQIDAMIGTSCNTAEQNPVGQFRRCAVFKSSVLSDYVKGITTGFHPVWLSNGVDPGSVDRDPNTAPAAGRCDQGFGEAGVWMCAQTNSMTGCQSEEFFIQGTQNINIGMGGIKFDFVAPLAEILDITAQPGDGAIVLGWTLKSVGDITGFRILCEDADTGLPVPGRTQPRPSLTAIPTGNFFYTKELLCPNGPFSDFDGDATTTGGDTTTGTTGDTGGTTSDGGGTTGGDVDLEIVCPNGQVELGEECDDGNMLDDDACRSDCTRNRCGDGVPWGTEQCDDGNLVDNDDCTNSCTTPTCGDGTLQPQSPDQEQCDAGAANSDDPGAPCTTLCKFSACEMGGSCTITCGNKVVDMGEACDLGANNSDRADCTNACQLPTCGDGLVRSDPSDPADLEECDDGPNNADTAACTTACKRNTCGDGLVQADVEECDDGPDNGEGNPCLPNCRAARCGDGAVQAGVEECDDGANNGADKQCADDCTLNASAAMLNLDWDYVCSGHIQYNTSSIRIEGLENGKNYNFLLVAYDLFGNPKAVDRIVRAAPVETYDLWEQCAVDGGVCGESGFCSVGSDPGGLAAVSAITMLGLGGLGVARRRRNRA